MQHGTWASGTTSLRLVSCLIAAPSLRARASKPTVVKLSYSSWVAHFFLFCTIKIFETYIQEEFKFANFQIFTTHCKLSTRYASSQILSSNGKLRGGKKSHNILFAGPCQYYTIDTYLTRYDKSACIVSKATIVCSLQCYCILIAYWATHSFMRFDSPLVTLVIAGQN